MKAMLSSLLLGLALVAGCATKEAENAGNQPNPRVDPGRVVILFSPPQRPYMDLGAVSTLKVQPDRGRTWQEVLRNQAAWKGADAVIVDTGTLNNITTTMVNGEAIRYAPPTAPAP
jgi:hypothetical protein